MHQSLGVSLLVQVCYVALVVADLEHLCQALLQVYVVQYCGTQSSIQLVAQKASV